MRRTRGGAVLFALTSTLLMTQPAMAFEVITDTGTTGEFTVNDTGFQPGAACLFENNPGSDHDELDAIRIRKLWSHGPFAQPSRVGFRYLIQRDAPPYGDRFITRFRSSNVKKLADDAEVAFFGPVTWHAPEGTQSRWRVRINLTYYAKGNPRKVIGRVVGQIEVYQSKLKGTSLRYQEGDEGNPWYCHAEFFPIPA